MKTQRKRLRLILAITMIAMLVGCSVFSPYVEPEVPRPGLVRDSEQKIVRDAQQKLQPTHVTVGEAREYARLLQDAYRQKITQLSQLRRLTNATLIGVAASAIGLAATGGATEAIAALGVGGAGLGAMGTQIVVSTQRQIYSQGALALECVISAAVRAPEATYNNADLENRRGALADTLAWVNRALAETQQAH